MSCGSAGDVASRLARWAGLGSGSGHCVLHAEGAWWVLAGDEASKPSGADAFREGGDLPRHRCRPVGASDRSRDGCRSPATVCREISRHGGRSRYRATSAERRAWASAERPQACKLALNHELRDLVAGKLSEDWSPQQIAGWLRLEHPEGRACWISHETIYRTLFIQTRGALRRELLAHLRRAGRLRRARGAKGMNAGPGRIRDAVSIRERPAEVHDRAIPGHWEGDLLAGAANTHVATIVERHSRFLMLVRVEGKDTQTVVAALTHHMGALPDQLRLSLTWDRGNQLAAHAQFTVATDLKVYFCDPQSPMAARLQREHQRPAAPIPTQRNRLLTAHTAAARRDRPQAQHAPREKHSAFTPQPLPSTQRCIDALRPPQAPLEDVALLFDALDPFAKLAELIALRGGQPVLAFSAVELALLDPVMQRLLAAAQRSRYVFHGPAREDELHQLAAKLRRIRRSGSWHHGHPFASKPLKPSRDLQTGATPHNTTEHPMPSATPTLTPDKSRRFERERDYTGCGRAPRGSPHSTT